MRVPALVCITLFGLALMGCTAGDVATVRKLTVEDGAAYVQENHSRRQEVRRMLYGFENEVFAACEDWARAAKFDQNVEEATKRIKVCLDFLNDAYPDLATVELLREGADSLNDLRARFRGEEPPQ